MGNKTVQPKVIMLHTSRGQYTHRYKAEIKCRILVSLQISQHFEDFSLTAFENISCLTLTVWKKITGAKGKATDD